MKTRILTTLLILLGGGYTAIGQVACGYGFSYSGNIPYTPLPSGNQTLLLASGSADPATSTSVSPTDEDFFPDQPIGFAFNYNGTTYTQCGVATNGWIWFGNTDPVKAAGIVIPFTQVLESEIGIEGIVSALNADLEGRWTAGLASIRTRTEGQAPNRTFTIEWNNFKALDDAEGTGYCGENRNRFDFQIILEEQNNKISFAYNAAPYCWQGYNQLFQVGLRGASRSDVHTRNIPAGNDSWAQSALGLSNSTAVIRSSSPVTIPAQNARFSFFPAQAATSTWLGISSDWNNPQNWNPAQVPNRCNSVIIPSGLSHYPELDGNQPVSCGNLLVSEGAAVTLKSTFNSFLSCYGSLTNNGVITNNTESYLTLAGGANVTIGGNGHFIGSDLFITTNSEYTLQNDLVIRNLSINDGSKLKLSDKILDVYAIQQRGTLDQGTGVLVIEGDASNVLLTDSTFEENNGTTFFGNGEIWANAVDQVVPSVNYNHLWVRTTKDHVVLLGTDEDFSCKNLLFYNPGEPGGQASTQHAITVRGDFRLGIDSLPGTELILNHTINRINGSGAFEMGKQDQLNVTHSSTAQQTVLSGFSTPIFKGTVSYTSSSEQTLVKGTYNNLNINGSGQRFIAGQVNLRGILKLNSGTLHSNDSLSLKSDSLATALISGTGAGTLVGKVGAERFIEGTGTKEVLLSSAFSDVAMEDYMRGIPTLGPDGISWQTQSAPAIWEYNESTGVSALSSGWQQGSSNSVMHRMTGYKTQQTGGTTIMAKGTVNSGIQKLALSRSGSSGFAGYNLAGNPYPSPIDWNSVAATLPVSISRSIHTLPKSDRYTGQFATWLPLGSNEGLGINGATQYVGMQEAFFVRAFNSDTLRLNNSHRADVTNVRSVSVPETIPFIRLSVNSNGKADETLVYYSQQANSNQATDGKDAVKMEPGGQVSYWYSIKDSLHLAIQGRHITEHADSIPLDVVVRQGGTHQFRLSEAIHFPMTAMIFLEDKVTHTIQNLRQQPEYTVVLEPGTIQGRFFLHYRPGVQVSALKEGCLGGDGQITLNNPTSTAWDVEVFTSTDSLVGSHTALIGNWVIDQLKADEYRVHFSLNGGTLETDEWVQVQAGSGITASFSASATEVKMEEEEVVFTSTTAGAESYFWNFGDGMMVSGESEVNHTFTDAGVFPVVLTAGRNECSDTAVIQIYVINITGIEEAGTKEKASFTVFPNPATTVAWLKPDLKENLKDAELAIIDISGKIAYQQKYSNINPGQLIEIPVSNLAKGNYQVLIHAQGFRAVNSLVVGGK
ncbi:MAG TPA: PKD domain-containing protein [Flavobacteriales bacterium]|nr:PKD domain-containing protein [Flavobacteriales bacterium]